MIIARRGVLPQRQCSVIVQPGEYLIDRWDNQQCIEKNPYHLFQCNGCEKWFCMTKHWGEHLDKESGCHS